MFIFRDLKRRRHLLIIGKAMGKVGEFIHEVYVKWEIQKIRLDNQNELKVDLQDPGFLQWKVLARKNEETSAEVL